MFDYIIVLPSQQMSQGSNMMASVISLKSRAFFKGMFLCYIVFVIYFMTSNFLSIK